MVFKMLSHCVVEWLWKTTNILGPRADFPNTKEVTATFCWLYLRTGLSLWSDVERCTALSYLQETFSKTM